MFNNYLKKVRVVTVFWLCIHTILRFSVSWYVELVVTINQFIKCRLVRLNFIFRLNNTEFGWSDANSLTYDATSTENGPAVDLLVGFRKGG